VDKIEQYTILAVDDAKDSLMLLEFDLKDSGYQVFTADSGSEALSIISEQTIHLILLDMHMPGLSGLQTLQKIKENPKFEHIPVIMLSASDNEDQIVSSLEKGADDYVTKPYILNVLLARMRNALRLMEKTMQLEALAKTDYLTKVNNRRSFEELVSKTTSQAKRSDTVLSFAMFDLDYFKKVNDNYGHEAGDKALVEFAEILKQSFRSYDIIGRIGGEEFAVCMPDTNIDAALMACERCRKQLAKHVIALNDDGKDVEISITVSIGITSGHGGVLSFEDLHRLADHALYKAKELGRNQSVIENNAQAIEHKEKMMDDEHINKAMNEQEHALSDEKYPGIDFQVGVNNVLGDESLFEEILVMFYQDHAQDKQNIANALAENDHQNLKHLVHTLKGVACSIGAMTLFETCKAFDQAVNQQQTEQYSALFEPVSVELSKVVSGIKSKLSDKV